MVYSNCWKGKSCNLGFSTQKDYHLGPKERERTQTSKNEKSLIPMCIHACNIASVVSDFVQPYGLQPARLLCPWDSPGKKTKVGYHALLPVTGIKSMPLMYLALTGRFFTTSATWEAHSIPAAAAAKSPQSCPTLCDPIDGSPPDSPIPGILQARTLEWVVISSSNAWKWKVKVKSPSRVQLLVTPWTAAYQAPPSLGFFQASVLEWVAIAFSGSTPNLP